MGGLIPLGDASRPPTRFALVTVLIILLNIYVFLQELAFGDRFVLMWSVIPIRIMHGHRLITLLTSMFMHASWMHIIGNMIFLWAFGPEIEDAMNPFRYLAFYLLGGVVAMMGEERLEAGQPDAVSQLEPMYIRPSEAELKSP